MFHVHKARMASKSIDISSDDDKSDSEASLEFSDHNLHDNANKGKAIVKNDFNLQGSLGNPFQKYSFLSPLHQKSRFEIPRNYLERKKTIPVTKESFNTILGLPIGGLPFGTNYDAGKNCILSKFGINSLPSVKFFRDLLIHNKDLDDDRLMIAFVIIALTSFLYPNSSLYPSTKYLTIFEDVALLDSYDWCKFVYEWCLLYIKKFHESNNLGGPSMYVKMKYSFLFSSNMKYLDFVDFGQKNVPRGIDENNYGLRPVKDICSTSYSEHAPNMDNSIPFRDKLDSAIGDLLPEYLKDNICTLLQSHCSASHANSNKSCEDLLISVLVMLAKDNVGILVQSDDINVNAGGDDAIQADDSEIPSCNTNANADEYVPLNDDLRHDIPFITNVGPLELLPSSLVVLQIQVLSVGDNEALKKIVASAVVAAAAAVRKVAIKFKLRLPQINNCASEKIDVDILRPTRHLFPGEEEANVTPSSYELSLHGISFHSVEDTPEEMICSKSKDQGGGKTPCVENLKKRVLKDITNSPEMVAGQSNFADRSKKMCATADRLYNSINQITNKSCDVSTSGGKIPQHGPRRILAPASCDVVNIDNVRVSFYTFGHSLMKGGYVSTSVMAVFCHLMFQNNHPSKSKKNYFFSSIGEQLIMNLSLADLEKVQKSFEGASKARSLHLCNVLYFPIHYNQHWFLLIVDIKDRMFVFMDSLHEADHEYFENIILLLEVWDKYVCTAMDFNSFKIVFPPVPHLESECDSGIFTMKYMEIWSPRTMMINEFTKEHINNIRVKSNFHVSLLLSESCFLICTVYFFCSYIK
uniref:Ubiquitin-like protease family profile domain-containing protein n=1 Tax=Oryza punctata TaxID=4537 RepID=A0A0E0MFH5_ORYPU